MMLIFMDWRVTLLVGRTVQITHIFVEYVNTVMANTFVEYEWDLRLRGVGFDVNGRRGERNGGFTRAGASDFAVKYDRQAGGQQGKGGDGMGRGPDDFVLGADGSSWFADKAQIVADDIYCGADDIH